MIGEIISAGVGVLGSLFGSKKQTTTSTVNYQQMVRNATAAGFNPLTALRNGGAAGFTTTTSPTVSQLPQALSALGGALGDAYEKKVDPLAQKQRQLDTALVDYQLRQLREGPKAIPGQLYPGGQTIGTKVTSARPSMGSSRKVAPYLEDGKLTNTDPWQWTGGLIKADPNRADGAAYEDAYGDFVGGVTGGVFPPLQDVWYNGKRAGAWYRDLWKEAERRDVENQRKRREAKEGKAYTVVPSPRRGPAGWWITN